MLSVNEFTVSTSTKETTSFVWGVKDIDRSEESMWDPEYEGTPIFDENFDLSQEAS